VKGEVPFSLGAWVEDVLCLVYVVVEGVDGLGGWKEAAGGWVAWRAC
jgi:hypothetical protein